MQMYLTFFEIDGLVDETEAVWCTTRDNAQEVVRTTSKALWRDIRIELREVPSDKDGLCAALNGAVNMSNTTLLRTWAVTPRGGLKEIPNGE